jgi:hypothetical protein
MPRRAAEQAADHTILGSPSDRYEPDDPYLDMSSPSYVHEILHEMPDHDLAEMLRRIAECRGAFSIALPYADRIALHEAAMRLDRLTEHPSLPTAKRE